MSWADDMIDAELDRRLSAGDSRTQSPAPLASLTINGLKRRIKQCKQRKNRLGADAAKAELKRRTQE